MRLLVFANLSRRFCKVRPKRSRLRLKMTPEEECLGPNPPSCNHFHLISKYDSCLKLKNIRTSFVLIKNTLLVCFFHHADLGCRNPRKMFGASFSQRLAQMCDVCTLTPLSSSHGYSRKTLKSLD